MGAYGPRIFRYSVWANIDIFLICIGLVNIIISFADSRRSHPNPDDSGMNALDQIMLLRVLRLFRLVRAAKVLIQFRDLWLLVQGLFNSVKPMVWVALILFLLIYCSAIVGMELMAVLGRD